MEYGPQWRKLRRCMGMFGSMTDVKKFAPSMDLESTVMMKDYLDEPDNAYQHHARFANSVVMTAGFGRRTERGDALVVSSLPKSPLIKNKILAQFTPVLEAMQPGIIPLGPV